MAVVPPGIQGMAALAEHPAPPTHTGRTALEAAGRADRSGPRVAVEVASGCTEGVATEQPRWEVSEPGVVAAAPALMALTGLQEELAALEVAALEVNQVRLPLAVPVAFASFGAMDAHTQRPMLELINNE